MKKRLTTIAKYALAIVLFTSLNSCKKKDKDSEDNPKPSITGSVVVSGRITGEVDDNDDQWSFDDPIAGVPVQVIVNTSSQVNEPDYQYNYNTGDYNNFADKVYNTVTDANGEYKVTVEMAQSGYVYVYLGDATYTHTYVNGSNPASKQVTIEWSSWPYYNDWYLSPGETVTWNVNNWWWY